MHKKEIKITIIGAGSWGTTLAVMLADRGNEIVHWIRSKEVYDDISENHLNSKYTRNLVIPNNVKPITGNCKKFTKGTQIIILAVPSYALRNVIKKFYRPLESAQNTIKCILNVAKGFETGTNLRLSEVIKQSLPKRLTEKVCSLSGPNIAFEVGNNMPSISVIASDNQEIMRFLQPILSTNTFRVYTNSDVIGVETGGAVKNIMAIASGISDGLGYGSNTKASIISRGIFELSKFGLFMGANPLTFSGAASIGDLIATCISSHSRNRRVGERLGQGESIDDILKSMYMVAEGVSTSRTVYEIAVNQKIDVPITECVYEIIFKNLSPQASVSQLMHRKFKSEIED